MTAVERIRFIAQSLDRGELSVLDQQASFISQHRAEIWDARSEQQRKAAGNRQAVNPSARPAPEPNDEDVDRDEVLDPDQPCECPCPECRDGRCKDCSNEDCDDLACVHGEDDEYEKETHDDDDETDDEDDGDYK